MWRETEVKQTQMEHKSPCKNGKRRKSLLKRKRTRQCVFEKEAEREREREREREKKITSYFCPL